MDRARRDEIRKVAQACFYAREIVEGWGGPDKAPEGAREAVEAADAAFKALGLGPVTITFAPGWTIHVTTAGEVEIREALDVRDSPEIEGEDPAGGEGYGCFADDRRPRSTPPVLDCCTCPARRLCRNPRKTWAFGA